MSDCLSPFASVEHAHNLSKVGKSKSPRSLAARMPNSDIASKVGGNDIYAAGARTRRVVRRNAD